MSEVVPLDRAERSKRARSGSRKKPDKMALVLGGGGFTGGVYEIGALRALDLLATNRTINEFDVYVGTSAGAFIASLAANGVTPEEMMRVLNPRLPSPFRDLDLGTLLRPNVRGFAGSAVRLPIRLASTAQDIVGLVRDTSLMDVAVGLADNLPGGLYTGEGIERYVAEVLSDPDRTDDFRMLDRELYLTATDLDTTERIVFGHGEWDDVPISLAVRASGCLPVVYEPVTVKDRELIDGGIRSTTNVDIAVEAGAKFIIVVNPLVPFVHDPGDEIPTAAGPPARRVSEMGMTAIANQAFRIIAHDRLHRQVEVWEQKYPGVDIVLIEPDLDDELMFGTSIMDYSARLRIAKHGFESVTVRLAREYDRIAEIAARHGVRISQRRVRHVIETVEREGDETPAWRRMFEQTTSALLRGAGD